MKLFISLILIVLCALPAWGAEYWVTQTGAGAQNGTSLENAWPQGSIVYGGANAAGRGDTLYLCGTPDAPITATIAPSGIGAFDGTANATADILEISGQADKCDGVEGKIRPASGHGINGSGIAALYVHDITCLGTTGTSANCFNQLLSSTSGCTASAGYFCGTQYNLTCAYSGAHCASIASSSNTNFPASAVPALYQHGITSTGAGGAAARIAINSSGALQERITSINDAQTINTWPVYQRGVTINCGAANNGNGVSWVPVSGTVYRTTQASCGASISTVADVYAANPATGVPGALTFDSCGTGPGSLGAADTACGAALSAGEYGVYLDNVYINKGDAPGDNAAVYLTYAWATDGVMQDLTVEAPGAAFDGVGVGMDFGTERGVVRRAFVKEAPVAAVSCGGGSRDCRIESSLSVDAGGPGAFRLASGADAYNLSSSGTQYVVYAYPLDGETSEVKNVAGTGADDALLVGRLDGTVNDSNNSVAPNFVGGTNPTTTDGFRLKPSSPLIGTGVVGTKYDYDNKRCGNPSNIGAFCSVYQDTRSSYSIRTDY